MTINIIGAGMAGLLAARLLRHRSPVVFEKQSSLPNNHHAVLRFRSDIVSRATNIPFSKVRMIKATYAFNNPVADTMTYARKCGGTYRTDRSIQTLPAESDRWIAPADFIEKMADGASINFDCDIMHVIGDQDPTISTIPMPSLMKILDYPNQPEFNYQSGSVIKFKVYGCDAYASIYDPRPDTPSSRISVTGDEACIEMPRTPAKLFGGWAQDRVVDACDLLGISINTKDNGLFGSVDINSIEWVDMHYSKIQPIDDDVRERFIHWATEKHGIYSLGRFATWRPGLLMDDLVEDIRMIDRWIGKQNLYEVSKHAAAK